MSDLACPWENRRESTEVTYSYVVTCFAAFAAYGHLEHSLSGNHDSVDILVKLLLFYLSPSAPLIDLVFLKLLPACAAWLGLITAKRVEYHSSSHRSGPYLSGTTRGLRFLSAAITGMHACKAGDEKVSVPVASSPHHRFQLRPREESRSVRIGQALVLGFLTVQCFGAVIKGVRRLERGSGLHGGNPAHRPAVVLADAEILWFALSGLAILACSWISFAQNRQWVLLEAEESSNDHQTISITTAALVFLCSLFSTFGYMDFYYDEPFWHVGFFHFLMPVPYLMGRASIETRQAIQRRLLLTRVTPSLVSLTVPLLVSTLIFRPRNRTLIATFWTLGSLSFAPLALSPLLEILWDLRLLGNIEDNWFRRPWVTVYFFYHFQPLFPFDWRWKWIVRVGASLSAAVVTMVVAMNKVHPLTTATATATTAAAAAVANQSPNSTTLSPERKYRTFASYFLLWYGLSAVTILVFATGTNSLHSIHNGLRNVGTDWPCPQLWSDPLFVPSF